MEQTPYQRLELFWQRKQIRNASGFVEAVGKGITAAALSAIKQRGSRPGAAIMRAIQDKFPDLNPDYILWGTGSMLINDQSLTRVSQPQMPPHFEEASPARTFMPTMAVNIDLEDMTPEQQISYWKLRYEKEARLRQEEQEAREHEETVRLVAGRGGKFNAGAEAADDDYTAPEMVAETNHEYIEQAAVPDRVRVAGFVMHKVAALV